MILLQQTKTWICPECSSLDYFSAADISREEWATAAAVEEE
jgi:hypothetical protein